MFEGITIKRGIADDVGKLKKELKLAFKRVKEEFSEHLETINQNTNEIQTHYEYLCELDSKIEKLSQRMDEMQMFLEHQKVDEMPKPSLTETEQKVFMALYTAEDSLLSYAELALKLNMSEIMVRNYIHNLMQKNVPVIRNNDGEKVLLSLDPEFKRLQATENILKISETMARQFA